MAHHTLATHVTAVSLSCAPALTHLLLSPIPAAQAVLSLEPHNREAAQQLASLAPPPPPLPSAAAGAPGEEQPAGREDQQQEGIKGPGEGQGQ